MRDKERKKTERGRETYLQITIARSRVGSCFMFDHEQRNMIRLRASKNKYKKRGILNPPLF